MGTNFDPGPAAIRRADDRPEVSFMTRSLSFTVPGALILLGVGIATAQDALVSARVTVPFSFRVGGASLPAGAYDVRFDNAEVPNVLRVRSANGHEAALVLVQNADVPEGGSQDPRLVFNKDGDGYVLTEVVDPGSRRALVVLGTRPSPESERTE